MTKLKLVKFCEIKEIILQLSKILFQYTTFRCLLSRKIHCSVDCIKLSGINLFFVMLRRNTWKVCRIAREGNNTIFFLLDKVLNGRNNIVWKLSIRLENCFFLYSFVSFCIWKIKPLDGCKKFINFLRSAEISNVYYGYSAPNTVRQFTMET